MLNILFVFTCSIDIYTFLDSGSIFDEICLLENEMKPTFQRIIREFQLTTVIKMDAESVMSGNIISFQ
jgi:hypothetical protein